MPLIRIILITLSLSSIPISHAAPVPQTVLDALKRANIPLSSVGIVVREANTYTPLLSYQAHQPMNPASTIKLLTTYAGLELLGADYTWKTEAYVDGTLEQDVLHGNLILKGYGNPKLTIEQLWLWMYELRSRGLREIRGDLVLDRSAFALSPHDPAAFDNDPTRPYNIGPDALLLNFGAIRLRFMPDGDSIKIYTLPKLAGYTLDNRLTLIPPEDLMENVPAKKIDCSALEKIITAELQGNVLLLQGDYPLACGERDLHLSPLTHPDYFYATFLALWKEMGGSIAGGVTENVVPSTATLFSTHRSPPLAEIIRDINKYSNNVMAHQVFLSLGNNHAAEVINTPKSNNPEANNPEATNPSATGDTANTPPLTAPPASMARSKLALRNWLARKQLNFSELHLENGAGLSRIARISPNSLALLLNSAQRSPMSAEFISSLPILGVDGTLRKRLANTTSASHGHLKTGSLEGVQAIAGYVQAYSGRQWIVVFLINHPNASYGQPAQDALLEWVQRR